MHYELRQVVRFAKRLYRTRRGADGRTINDTSPRISSHLTTQIENVWHQFQLLSRANQLNLPKVTQNLQQQLLNTCRNFHVDELAERKHNEDIAEETFGATIPDIVMDLLYIQKEFPEVCFDLKTGEMSVTTHPVVLEWDDDEIDFGQFKIHLSPNGEWWPEALQPVRPFPESSLVHPHIDDQNMCASEELIEAIHYALTQQRYLDIFRMIDAALNTYNDSDRYAPIWDWIGHRCSKCDEISRDRTSCEACGSNVCLNCLSVCCCCEHRFCENCIDQCNCCDQPVCEGCSHHCEACDERMCTHCSVECEGCDVLICRDCITACIRCGARICEGCITYCEHCNNQYCEMCIEDHLNNCKARPVEKEKV